VNVALVVERMDVTLGGRERYTAQVAAALACKGVDVTIVCQQAKFESTGVKIVELGRRGALRYSKLANFIADARAYLRKNRFDIVHAMMSLPGADIYQPHGGIAPAALQNRLERRGVLGKIFTRLAWPLNFNRMVSSAFEKQIVKDKSTCCLCVSDKIAHEFKRYFGRVENVRVLFNGVDCPPADTPSRDKWRRQRRGELGIADDEIVFLTAANNFELKGVPQLIHAFAAWQGRTQKRGRLIIVGRGNIAKYQALASRLGAGGKVHFAAVTTEIFQWYAAADVIALLSWYDACGLVLLEAVSWGIPTLTTINAGAAGLVAAGRCGLVVSSPEDRPAIAAALEKLSDVNTRAAMSGAGLKLGPTLTIGRHVDELIELYRQLQKKK